jgi:spermidine dehydrogenase
MIVGDYQPPLDPDKPALITFYVPFYYPGHTVHEQGVKGRTELLSTSYADYEQKIKKQMTKLFGKAGFDPEKDIAGIILNRWGHAYVNPQPGFYFGRDGQPAPRSAIRRRFGRIAFGHSELNGHQHWLGAVEEGIRSARRL